MKKISQASPILKAFVGVGLLYGCIFLIFTPRISFDDRQMASIVSGMFMRQTPSEFLLFTHPFIGYFLKSLYLLYDGFAWYDFYLLLSLFLSHSVIFYVLLKHHQTSFSWKSLFLFFLMGSMILYGLVRVYFTIVGAYVGLAGLLLFYQECCTKNPRKVALGMAVFLMWWASCIRFHSLILAILLSTPLVSYFLFEYHESIKINYRSKLFFLCFAILVITAGRIGHSYIYNQNPEWINYPIKLQYLTAILDYEHLPSGPYQAVYQKHQWSKNDHAMLQSWFFTDEHTFGLERFKNLMADHSIYTPKFIRQRGVWFVLSRLKVAFTSTHAQLAYIGWLFLFMATGRHKKFIWLTIFIVLEMLFLFLYLAYFMKISEYHIVYLFFSIAILTLATSIHFSAQSKWIKWIGIFNIFLLISHSTYSNYQQSQTNQQGIAGFQQLMQSLRKDKLYIWWDIAPNYLATGFLNSPHQIKGINLIHLGTGSYKALIQETLDKYQMKNLHEGMINHKEVILVSRDYKNDFYQRYMKEHYNRDITFELLEEKHQFKFYKVLEKP